MSKNTDYSRANNKKRVRRRKQTGRKLKHGASTMFMRVLLAVFIIAVFAAAGGAFGVYLGILQNAPKLDMINVKPPDVYPSIVVDAQGNEIDRFTGAENRAYVTIDKIPECVRNAFIALEDERFYQHNGVDVRGMARSVVEKLTGGGTQGASTITQQVIKNDIMKLSRNTIITKLQEQYLAVKYENELAAQYGSRQAAKEHILEVYLNSINLANGQYGVETASEYYFNKDVSQLNISEAAVIAAITQNPTKYNPLATVNNNQTRRKSCLDSMLRLNLITQAEHDRAMADDVYDRISKNDTVIQQNATYHSYFTDKVVTDVVDDLVAQGKAANPQEAYNWVYSYGLTIYSTEDTSMQAVMDKAFTDDSYFSKKEYEVDIQYLISFKNRVTGKVTNTEKDGTVKTMADVAGFVANAKKSLLTTDDDILAEQTIPIPQPQAAMIIEDYRTGEVKAVEGGRGQKLTNLALNRATDSARQPGSVFKVLASYAPGIDMEKITPATVIDDVPYTYAPLNYSPHNWYFNPPWRGLSTVRDGITASMNVLTVHNMVNCGIDDCYQYLKNFGFTTLVDHAVRNGKGVTDKGPATCLGGLTDGVTQEELCAAYSTIANGGVYIKPKFYTKVLDHGGNIILDNTQPESRTVMKKTAAWLITNMMQDVITSSNGTGGKAALKGVTGIPVSGKTGTTTATRDVMFAGYTPYYAATIWMGYDQPKEIADNGGYQMNIWSAVMSAIHKDLPAKGFDKPSGIVSADVCRDSGLLPVAGECDSDPRGSRVHTEYFIAGTQPTDYCEVHQSKTVTQYPWSAENGVADAIQKLVGIVRPVPYNGSETVRDQQYELYRELAGQGYYVQDSGGGWTPYDNSTAPASTQTSISIDQQLAEQAAQQAQQSPEAQPQQAQPQQAQPQPPPDNSVSIDQQLAEQAARQGQQSPEAQQN